MKRTLTALLIAAATLLAPTANAQPALCAKHSDHDSWKFGAAKAGKPDRSYITACAGDSGGNNVATAPTIHTGPAKK